VANNIKLIVAVDRGNAIGWTDGRLPWKLPDDMARFKALTTGKTVVMGSNTFRSLNRPLGLPNRRNVVLTKQRSTGWNPEIVTYNGLDLVELDRGLYDQWIIGGASVYTQALERKMVDELYVTMVDASSGADVTLPFDLYSWKLFVIRERSAGTNWEVTDMQHQMTNGIKVTFLTLAKTKV
jgi:dihydrofolate reductase